MLNLRSHGSTDTLLILACISLESRTFSKFFIQKIRIYQTRMINDIIMEIKDSKKFSKNVQLLNVNIRL